MKVRSRQFVAKDIYYVSYEAPLILIVADLSITFFPAVSLTRVAVSRNDIGKHYQWTKIISLPNPEKNLFHEIIGRWKKCQ